MTWYRIGFDDSITHVVHEKLRDPLVVEMTARGMPVSDYAVKYSPQTAEELGGNPRVITEWGLDLGGSLRLGEPVEVIAIDGLSVEVPCFQWEGITRTINRCELRRFHPSGLDYYKVKVWIHATVRMPPQFDALRFEIVARTRIAADRAEAFARACKRGVAS